MVLFGTSSWAQPGISEEDTRLFEEDIRPILEENCFKCHGGETEIQGGLILTSRGGVLRGGDRGAVIDFDHPENSVLLDMISWRDDNHQMPPPGKLQAWDIDALTEWVMAGVPWPGGETEPIDPPLLHGFTRESPELWAFRPVSQPPEPAVPEPAWAGNPVDALIFAKLESAGLKPAPPASRRALIRRIYYDLTARQGGVVRRRRIAGRVRKTGGRIARVAAVRGAMGAALARPRAVRRFERLRTRHQQALHVALPRLRD
jgi:hypothetical protein